MVESQIEIDSPDGVVDALLVRPDGAGPWPGILYVTDIRGIRDEFRAWIADIVRRGFVVLLPNVFFRTGRPPIFESEFRPTEPETRARMMELLRSLTPDAMAQDGARYLQTLRGCGGVANGPLGVVGHCLGGGFALRTAAARPDEVGVAVSLHGGNLCTAASDSPHLLLPRIRSQLYFGHATADPTMSAEAITTLEASLKDWGGSYESETYDGALHGWTIPGGATYHPEQSRRAFDKLLDVLRGRLLGELG